MVRPRVDLPGRGAMVQNLSTSPLPRPVATYIRHRTHHTFHDPKAVRQRFTLTILARGVIPATKLLITFRNARRTSSTR